MMNDVLSKNQIEATQLLVDLWHKGVKERDVGLLLSLFAKDVSLSTPFSSEPFKGGEEVLKTLRAFDQSVEKFCYLSSIIQADSACLFFEAWIKGEHLQGVDVIRFDSEGKITTFEVMARPLKAIQHLHDAVLKSDSKQNGNQLMLMSIRG